MNGSHGVRLLCLVTAFVVAGTSAGRGQPGRGQAPAEEPRGIFFEAVPMLGPDTAARVDFLYRIDREFFVAIRDPDSTRVPVFRRHGEVLVELLDSGGVSRARQIDRLSGTEDAVEPARSGKRWFTGAASLTVPAGRYSISFQVDDLGSEREFADRSRTIEARRAGRDTIPDGGPLMLAGIPDGPSTPLVPQNFGGDVLFGPGGGLAFEVAGAIPDTARFSCRVAENPPPGSRATPAAVLDTLIFPILLPGSVQTPLRVEGDTVRYSLAGTGEGTTTVVIPLPLERLPLRSYMLTGELKAGEMHKRISLRFRNVWPDMPASLRDVDQALDALRFVTTPPQLDSLKRGSFTERRDALEAFWKPRDPDPATAHNPVMTEYYRRVDEAVRRFGTLRDPDGSRTDRGRIFILHGPPADVERSLDPRTGYREVWTYANPPKTFVFVDANRTGAYVLVTPKNQ